MALLGGQLLPSVLLKVLAKLIEENAGVGRQCIGGGQRLPKAMKWHLDILLRC